MQIAAPSAGFATGVEPRRPWLDQRRAFYLVALVAAITHLWALASALASPFFHAPILDEAWYTAAARALRAGAEVPDPGFRPLLYPAFLALFGDDTLGAILSLAVQHLLGIGVALGAAELARRSAGGDPRATLAGGTLIALAGPPLVILGQRLSEALFVPVLVAAVVALARIERPIAAPIAGTLIGIGALLRPNGLVLVLVPGMVAWLAWRDRRLALRAAALAGAATCVVLALGTAILGLAGRSGPLLGSSGGVNLYLGLARGADGLQPRQQGGVIYDQEYRDSVAAWAEHAYRAAEGDDRASTATPRELSRYWGRRALDEVRADPLGRLGLILRKAGYLVWNAEVPNHLSWSFLAADSFLGWLPVRWWLLLALAPLGVLADIGRERAAAQSARAAAGLAALVLALAILPFFVADRYRLPLWPLLAALAGVGAVDLWDRLRQKRPFVRRLGLGCAIAVLSLSPLLGAALPDHGRDHYFRSIAALAAGELELARDDAAEAARLDPDEAAVALQQALVALAANDAGGALEHASRGLELSPRDPRLLNVAASALERLGRLAAAYAAWSRAATDFDHSPSLVNLALLELRAGLDQRARGHLARMAPSDPPTPWALVAAAELARREGRSDLASQLRGQARALDPVTSAAVEADLARALSPTDLGLVREEVLP